MVYFDCISCVRYTILVGNPLKFYNVFGLFELLVKRSSRVREIRCLLPAPQLESYQWLKQWLSSGYSCRALGVIGSVLELVGPLSVL